MFLKGQPMTLSRSGSDQSPDGDEIKFLMAVLDNPFEVRPENFDLVIADLTMIHMTGVDLEREIFVSRRDTQIILCT
jgi:CheY-like chemotaxis protein